VWEASEGLRAAAEMVLFQRSAVHDALLSNKGFRLRGGKRKAAT